MQLLRRLLWVLQHGLVLMPLCVSGIAVAQAPPETSKSALVARYLGRSAELLPLNPAAALAAGQQALHLAATTDSAAAIGAAYVAMGVALQAQRRYEEALRCFKQASQAYQQANDQHGQVGVLCHLGGTLYAQGDTGQAHNTALRALKLAQQLHDPAEIARAQAQLGELYGLQRLWGRALSSHERAYTSWQQAANPGGEAAALNEIGLAHFRLRHYSRALYYLNRALTSARQLRDSTRNGEALASTAQVYDELGNYETAQQFYTQALRQLPRATPPARRAEGLRALAATHDLMGNRPAAIRALQQALPLARRGGSTVQLSGLYTALTAVYRRQGNYQSALAAQMQYGALQDSVFAEQRAGQIAELQTRYETEKKEREIQLLTKDRQIQLVSLQRQMLLRNVLAVGALLLLAVAVVLYRSRRRQHHLNRLLQRKNRAISRQKEELAHLNHTKDTLFSIISHDLRSPLSSLYSLFSLINMGNLPPERLAAHSQRLTRTLDVTLRLLDNLLNWSASQMQGDQVRPERVRLQLVAEEAMALLLGDAERKSILLLSEIPTFSAVRADLNMVRLILRNLLGNAIKFTPANGEVKVTARFLEAEGRWEISVADTGVGIAPPDLPRIFGASGHHSTLGTDLEKGTGLGLRLCKEFVERNNGRISCESRPGSGTIVRFTLPAAGPEAVPVVAVEPATAAAAG